MSFEQLILSETNGNGVDLVLNSLSGDKLKASLRCLTFGGRFLEIGKYDLSNDTPLGMSIFLKSISFHGILFDALYASSAHEKAMIWNLVQQGIADGVVKPLPSTVFPASEMEKSYR